MDLKKEKRLKQLRIDYEDVFIDYPSQWICIVNVGDQFMATDIDLKHLKIIIHRTCLFIIFDSTADAKEFYNNYNHCKLDNMNRKLILSYCTKLPCYKHSIPFARYKKSTNRLVFDQIPGLVLYEDFISKEEEVAFLTFFESQTLLHIKDRDVAHYGHEYSYRSFGIGSNCYPVPLIITQFLEKLTCVLVPLPNQFTLTKYIPGSGIPMHTDIIDGIGPQIASLSFLNPIIFHFTDSSSSTSLQILLNPRSLLVMDKEARYTFQHGIKERKSDLLQDGSVCKRKTRWSITMRHVYEC